MEYYLLRKNESVFIVRERPPDGADFVGPFGYKQCIWLYNKAIERGCAPAVIMPDGDVHSRFLFHCPACGGSHFFQTNAGEQPHWAWNENYVLPTITPSIRVRFGKGMSRCCHFIVTDGKIAYCTDCTHGMAGETVDMVPWVRN